MELLVRCSASFIAKRQKCYLTSCFAVEFDFNAMIE